MSKQDYRILVDKVIGATKVQMANSNRFFITKVVLIVATYIFLLMNSVTDVMSPTYVPECIHDSMQEYTLPINKHLVANPVQKSALIIVASAMIDINVFVMSMRWIFFGKNYKTFICFLMFYLFRTLVQTVFFMRFPDHYIWGNPGLFSVTVPYFPANDFFFSGHVGMCVICFLDFKRDNVKFMKTFSFISIFVEFFTLLVTRAHYFIDLVTGLVVSHYVYLCSDWLYEYLAKRREAKQIANNQGDETASEADSETKSEAKSETRQEAKPKVKNGKKVKKSIRKPLVAV